MQSVSNDPQILEVNILSNIPNLESQKLSSSTLDILRAKYRINKIKRRQIDVSKAMPRHKGNPEHISKVDEIFISYVSDPDSKTKSCVPVIVRPMSLTRSKITKSSWERLKFMFQFIKEIDIHQLDQNFVLELGGDEENTAKQSLLHEISFWREANVSEFSDLENLDNIFGLGNSWIWEKNQYMNELKNYFISEFDISEDEFSLMILIYALNLNRDSQEILKEIFINESDDDVHQIMRKSFNSLMQKMIVDSQRGLTLVTLGNISLNTNLAIHVIDLFEHINNNGMVFNNNISILNTAIELMLES